MTNQGRKSSEKMAKLKRGNHSTRVSRRRLQANCVGKAASQNVQTRIGFIR